MSWQWIPSNVRSSWRYNTELQLVTVDEVLDLVLQEETVFERVPRAIHMEFALLSWVIPRGIVAFIILRRHRATSGNER